MRTCFAMLLAVGILVAANASAPAAKPGKSAIQTGQKKHAHVFHGVVVHVHHDKDTGHGHFLVKEHHKAKTAGAGVQVIEKKFHVNAGTTFEVVGKNGTAGNGAGASLAQLHKGEHVVVHYKNHPEKNGKHEHLATDVKIHHRK